MNVLKMLWMCFTCIALVTGCGSKAVEATSVLISESEQIEVSGEKIITEDGESVDTEIPREKAIEIAKEKQKQLFGVEIKDDALVEIEIEEDNYLNELKWLVGIAYDDTYFTTFVINSDDGSVTYGTYMSAIQTEFDGVDLTLEKAQDVAINFLVDTKMINVKNDVNYIGLHSEYLSDEGISLDFESVEKKNYIYNVVVDKRSKKVISFMNYDDSSNH